MQHTIVLKKTADSGWRAFAPLLPECTVEAATREEALARMQERLVAAQDDFEVVQLEVPFTANGSPHANGASRDATMKPSLPGYGAFKDDPFLDAIYDEIERRRDELMLIAGRTVEVTQNYDKTWRAVALWLQNCEVIAPSRDEAIDLIEAKLIRDFAEVEEESKPMSAAN